jgi:hypothetical protein
VGVREVRDSNHHCDFEYVFDVVVVVVVVVVARVWMVFVKMKPTMRIRSGWV